MIRKLLIIGAAAIVGYVIGVRAGFDTGVRDYVENNSEMLERVAISKDKFDYPVDVTSANGSEEIDEEDYFSESAFQ